MAEGIFTHWPNRITALRFIGSLLLFLLLTGWGEQRGAIQASFWLFIVVALTDALDGWLARRDNLVTAFGRISDPFVDKIMVVGTMMYLAVLSWGQDFFPAWVVVVVLAREFLVTGIRGYSESLGQAFPADRFGKLKMVVQCIAIGVVMGRAAFPWPDFMLELSVWPAHAFVWATVVTSIGSGITYVYKSRHLLLEGTV